MATDELDSRDEDAYPQADIRNRFNDWSPKEESLGWKKVVLLLIIIFAIPGTAIFYKYLYPPIHAWLSISPEDYSRIQRYSDSCTATVDNRRIIFPCRRY